MRDGLCEVKCVVFKPMMSHVTSKSCDLVVFGPLIENITRDVLGGFWGVLGFFEGSWKRTVFRSSF